MLKLYILYRHYSFLHNPSKSDTEGWINSISTRISLKHAARYLSSASTKGQPVEKDRDWRRDKIL